MPDTKPIRRQGVVVIHGMGEQTPMDTLHSFVEGITKRIRGFVPGHERSPPLEPSGRLVGNL